MSELMIRKLKVPPELWAQAAAKAREVGLPTTTWLLGVITRAVQRE